MSYPLDPGPEQMREMGEAALAYVIGFIGSLDEAPASNVEGAWEVAHRLRTTPPEEGGPFEDVLGDVRDAAAHAYDTTGPGYLPYIPGGGLFAAALGDFLALSVNRYVGLAAPSPAVVQIEENVCRWLCSLFGWGDGSLGVLTSGGSMANFSAMVAARHAKLGEDFTDGVYYVSEQAHASVTKAATLAGFTRRNVRLVPTDDELRMDPNALRCMVEQDLADGHRPFLVGPSAGTTNTGAIDPLEAIADVAEEHGLWMHVDGAYGGFFVLTARGRERFRGIERADSVTLDPHKGMFLPYGTGALVVRDGENLRQAHYEGAAYLQDLATAGELPNYSEHSAELSREWRGLRVWLPLRLHGVRAFREALDEKLDLAEVLYEGLKAVPELELPWAPQLTVVPFRLRDGDRAVNEELLDRINASQRVFLSSTTIHDRYAIRACIVSHRTHRDRIDECIEIVARATAEVAG